MGVGATIGWPPELRPIIDSRLSLSGIDKSPCTVGLDLLLGEITPQSKREYSTRDLSFSPPKLMPEAAYLSFHNTRFEDLMSHHAGNVPVHIKRQSFCQHSQAAIILLALWLPHEARTTGFTYAGDHWADSLAKIITKAKAKAFSIESWCRTEIDLQEKSLWR